MTDSEQSLIMDLTAKRISKADFIERLSISDENKFVIDSLEKAYREQNADDVEYALLLGFAFGFSLDSASVLSKLLVESWHQKHEDLAIVLKDLKSESSIPALYRAALSNHSYLEYDDGYALKSKCAWALGAINSEHSIEKLEQLKESDDQIASSEASKQLERLNTCG